MNELRIGIIGTFGHIRDVLNNVPAVPGARIAALAAALPDEQPDSLRSHPAVGPLPPLFMDYRQMLASQKPDLVVIGTRLDRIAPIAVEAVRAGCHVIAEKPLALDHEALRALWSAVADARVECMAMLNMRALPAFAAARRFVRQGGIGDTILANGRKSYKWGNARPEWFGRRQLYGGTIGWVGIHAFDFIHYVTGRTFRAVAAMQSNAAHPDHPDCEDNCSIVAQLDNGAHASISVDFLRPQAAPTHGDDWVRIVGSAGVVEANATRAVCEVIDAQGRRELPLPEAPPVYAPLFRKLMGDTDARPPATTPDSFMLTHACLCARDAADTARIVRIPEAPWD